MSHGWIAAKRSNGSAMRAGRRQQAVAIEPRLQVAAHDANATRCVCGSSENELLHVYDRPPIGETRFQLPDGEPYWREIHRCRRCGHFSLSGTTIPSESYRGAYMQQTYASDNGERLAGIRRAFARIRNLRLGESDNAGRVERVDAFARKWFSDVSDRMLLDVGIGLGVFIAGMRERGWNCTGVDPDADACAHLEKYVGAPAVCAMFEEMHDAGPFDVITFNKVLEHVREPIGMLGRTAGMLTRRGIAYIEVPDGEGAWDAGPGREEFFIEHLHAFTMASLVITVQQAGLRVIECGRLREPSGKFTLFAFAALPNGERASACADCCEGAD